MAEKRTTMIVCYQYKVYPKPIYSKNSEPYYHFGKPNKFGNPCLYLNYYDNIMQPIAAWKIKKLFFCLMRYDQAKTYKEAVSYFNKSWGNKYKGLYLRKTEPDSIPCAC